MKTVHTEQIKQKNIHLFITLLWCLKSQRGFLNTQLIQKLCALLSTTSIKQKNFCA